MRGDESTRGGEVNGIGNIETGTRRAGTLRSSGWKRGRAAARGDGWWTVSSMSWKKNSPKLGWGRGGEKERSMVSGKCSLRGRSVLHPRNTKHRAGMQNTKLEKETWGE